MAYATYRITFKSEEQRGASSPNIIELQFDSDADAIQFGHNYEQCSEAKLVSVDKLLSSDYSLPYPVGTDGMTRSAITDGTVHWAQLRVYDTPGGFDVSARAAALIGSGFKILSRDGATMYAPTSVNIQKFLPGVSH